MTVDVYDARTVKRRFAWVCPRARSPPASDLTRSGLLVVLVHAPGSTKTTIYVYDVNRGTELGTIGQSFDFQLPGVLRSRFRRTARSWQILSSVIARLQ